MRASENGRRRRHQTYRSFLGGRVLKIEFNKKEGCPLCGNEGIYRRKDTLKVCKCDKGKSLIDPSSIFSEVFINLK